MASETTTSSPKRRGRPKSGASREALIEAAQSLLASGRRVTTGEVARKAGLAQPTFYAHFTSVDECRLAAVEAAVTRLAALEERRRARTTSRPADLDAFTQELEHWLAACADAGDVMSIYQRHRDDPGAVGATLRAMGEHHLTTLTNDLWRMAIRCGVDAESYTDFRLLAVMQTAQVAAVARAMHQGELTDPHRAARMLALSIATAFRAAVAMCGGDPSELSSRA